MIICIMFSLINSVKFNVIDKKSNFMIKSLLMIVICRLKMDFNLLMIVICV